MLPTPPADVSREARPSQEALELGVDQPAKKRVTWGDMAGTLDVVGAGSGRGRGAHPRGATVAAVPCRLHASFACSAPPPSRGLDARPPSPPTQSMRRAPRVLAGRV